VRLFAAVPLPDEAVPSAVGTLKRLGAEGWPVRWVHEENLHLTLKFFGELTPDRLDTITEMLGFAVEGMHPMTMSIRGAGVFPHANRPRVIRLDLEAEPELELLQDRIERGGERIGFPPEGRPFHPHITLGRVREGHRLPPNALELLEGVSPQPAFLATKIVLFESELGPGGPRYAARTEYDLGR
jgi:2'-5' RNA ligase